MNPQDERDVAMKRRKGRRWLLAPATAGLAVIGVLGLAHTPVGRAFVWSQVHKALGGYGIDARSTRLEYNLLTLDLRVRNVALSVPGRTEFPFFAADVIHVKLLPKVLLGRWAAEAIEIDRPRVNLRRDSKGIVNWPEFPARAQATGSAPIDLGTVRVRQFESRSRTNRRIIPSTSAPCRSNCHRRPVNGSEPSRSMAPRSCTKGSATSR